jgi:hypothetical protein
MLAFVGYRRAMTKRPYEDKMHLDMPFDEALERFVGTDPAEMRANIEKSKAAKPPAARAEAKATGKPDTQNVTELRGKRKPKDVRKLLRG